MPATTTSRHAATGLPDVRNHFAFSDNTYFADGVTFPEFKGSVLAGENEGPTRQGRAPGAVLRQIFRE